MLSRFIIATLFLASSTDAFTTTPMAINCRSIINHKLVVYAAASYEEDLEMTRQIIFGSFSEKQAKTQQQQQEPVLENDLMIRAAFGQFVERTPVWLFRQAGRHLPEYEAFKQKTNRNFLQLLADPASVAECTLQPVRRYNLDAAILFSDILVIPEALGIQVTMPGGVGIQVPHPLQGPDEVTSRLVPTAELTNEWVQQHLGHVLTAVRQIRTSMADEHISIPLIGFSAAPWTLMYYMVGGSSKKNQDIGVAWLRNHPTESRLLLDKLTQVVVEYMSAQVDAGAHILQLFEAMGMHIDNDNFQEFAMPCLESIALELKRRHPQVPLMVFARGACQMNDKLAQLGCFDVITMDGDVDRKTAREIIGANVSLQGNYDPAELIQENGKTPETVRATARKLLEELGPQRLIANLGEGLGGKESTELVDAFVNAIHEESEKMMMASQK
jgi:uroporphyrinogen decarboxylase